ncbi:MAG: helix-turn-helix domain-containing protein [Actinomycetaceae bacterium]|nr:helix-turn-helix domain-containing protein [Actinomycetaceae bacterium]
MQFDISEWRASASSQFGKMTITPYAEDFTAELAEARVGDIFLFDMITPAHRVVRDAASILDSDPQTYKLSLQIEGCTILTQFGRECIVEPGSLAVYHSRVPYSLDYPTAQRSLIMQFPSDRVKLPPSAMEHITALPISRQDRLGAVAIPLFEQLAANFNVLEGPHAGSLLNAAIDMLVAVFAEELSTNSPATPPIARKAMAFIEDHLDDPDLGPTMIADELFISVRHLHSQFALTGQSVGAYIKQTRMQNIRRDLANPMKKSEPIQQVGARYGIHSPAHLSRVFKEAYGETPRAYRKRILEA